MKISLVTIGSTGDVRPYMLLGKELKKRGHTVTIAAFASFQKMVTDAGLEFYPLSGDVVKLMSNIMKPSVKGINYLNEVEKALKEVAPMLLNDLTMSCQGADAIGPHRDHEQCHQCQIDVEDMDAAVVWNEVAFQCEIDGVRHHCHTGYPPEDTLPPGTLFYIPQVKI